MTETDVERELKLSVPLSWELGTDRLGAYRLGHEEVVELRATYYDTADLRLARAGASLRHRDPDGWTVKLPTTSVGLLTRTEISVAAPPGLVPADLAEIVLGLTRGAPLLPVAQVSTERRVAPIRDHRDRQVAELTDDRVQAAPIGDAMVDVRQFRELEVELGAGTPRKVAARVADELRNAGARDTPPLSKIVRVLGPAAREPGDVPEPDEIDARSDVAALVTAAIRRSVRALIAHDAQMRLTDEPDEVHDARVAIRRLRADLRTFAPVLRGSELDETLEHLRWLGGALGEVRDADVLSANIVAASVELSEIDQIESLALQQQLTDERRAAYERLLEDLRSPRYLVLLDRLVELAASPPLKPKRASRLAADEIVVLVERRWERLEARVDGLDPRPEADALHAVRIAAKKARYAAEASTAVVGRDARRFAKRLAKLQDVLGDHHDAGAGRVWLTAAAASGPVDGYSAFVAGEIAHVLLERQRDIEETWRERWADVVARRPATWSR